MTVLLSCPHRTATLCNKDTHIQIKFLRFKALKPLLVSINHWWLLLLFVNFKQRSHVDVTACETFQQRAVSYVKRFPQLLGQQRQRQLIYIYTSIVYINTLAETLMYHIVLGFSFTGRSTLTCCRPKHSVTPLHLGFFSGIVHRLDSHISRVLKHWR